MPFRASMIPKEKGLGAELTYDADIRKLELQALFDIKGRIENLRFYLGEMASNFPVSPNTFKLQGSGIAYFLGPDHWLLRADRCEEAQLLETLRPDSAPDNVSIVLVSDTLVFFEIGGRHAEDIMEIATSLDVHPSAFLANGATYTEAFGIKALASRKVGGGGFELAFDRSYEDMISECLRRILS